MKKLIMTDLDCTLLPMDQDLYIKMYVNEVAKLFCELGFDGKAIAKATMQASFMMATNDGTKTNEVAFNQAFSKIIGEKASELLDIFPQVYADRYEVIRESTTPNPYIKEIVGLMKEKAEHVVIATQPMFPIEAVERRLSWIGLSADMFDFVTTFDKCSYCKPNPMFYKEIMDRYGASAEDTVMFGNDVNEDILPCTEINVESFLVLDGLINAQNHDISNLNKGNYKDMIEYLRSL
ncbi:MAG: HAD family hydrolase [Eubacteriales bacterium]|nr:HAD family hydrolase [Eubacteriales bacterium]